jgi:peptide/nickel transport system substrate-binding protein
MKPLLNSKLLLNTVLFLPLLVALACSPANSESRPATDAAPSPTLIASPVAAPAAVPLAVVASNTGAGGSLTVAGLADIPHRDVHQEVQEALTTLGPGLAYSRLLRLSASQGGGQSGQILECDLCQSWRMTSDFSYEFRLRPNVRWQNIPPVSGRPLVAQDLVFSYNRMRTPGWPNAPLLSPIGSVTALDPQTLRVRLAFADSDGLLALADGHSKIVAPEVVELYGDLKDSPVIGTGPWVWEGSIGGQQTVLVRNPDYFEPGRPFLDRLEIRNIRHRLGGTPGSLARVAAYQAGQVDALSPDIQEWQAIQTIGRPVSSVVSQQGGPGLLLSLNVQEPALADVAVRQAIFKAIDPWDYLDKFWSGQGQVGVGLPVLQPDWLLSREELRGRYFADPSRSRSLLAGSGFQLPLDLELAVGDFGPAYLASAERLAGDLRAVGLNTTIRRMTPAQFQDRVMGPDRKYQIALGTLPPSTSINGFLAPVLHSGGRWNVSGHRDTRLDAMIEGQAVQLEPARRREQVLDIQRHVLEQAYLFSPVTGATRWAFRPDVQDFHPSAALSEYLFWSQVRRES